jgi:hypothetical protein
VERKRCELGTTQVLQELDDSTDLESTRGSHSSVVVPFGCYLLLGEIALSPISKNNTNLGGAVEKQYRSL